MPIAVVPQSASIDIWQPPAAKPPFIRKAKNPPPAGWMSFTGDGLKAIGKCEITGLTTDDPGGWTLGMIQLQWIMTDWAYYRGQTNSDGDSFLQYGRPPARPTQACRDTRKPRAIFVDLDPSNRTMPELAIRFRSR